MKFRKNCFVFLIGLLVGVLMTASVLYSNGMLDYAIGKSENAYSNKRPLIVNGGKVDANTYMIQDSLYIPIQAIQDNTHLLINNVNQKVQITDASFIKIKDFKEDKEFMKRDRVKQCSNTKYVDMTYWFLRYNANQSLEGSNGQIAAMSLPYSFEKDSLNGAYDKRTNVLNVIMGLPFEQYGSSWYLNYDDYAHYVHPLMPEIISKNEAVIEELKQLD